MTNKKLVAFLALAVIASIVGFALLHAAEDPMRIPDSIGVRVRSVQLDSEKAQGQINQIAITLQQQYLNQVGPFQKIVDADKHELDLLKEEALKSPNAPVTVKKETSQYDVNIDTLTYVAKPTPPVKDKK